MESDDFLIKPHELILVTGATGFIGSRVVRNLWDRGFRNLRCFTRRVGAEDALNGVLGSDVGADGVDVMQGNLLSREDCAKAVGNVAVVFHLAAGRGEKSYAAAFANSVVTTRNLLDAAAEHGRVKRLVLVSSFSVYTNRRKPRSRLLDESCPVETHPESFCNAYTFAKVKQDEIAIGRAVRYGIPYVVVRPGYVYGPGNLGITGRVGTGAFGLFLHMGGSNKIPFTYVDNCADAIVRAGLTKGVEGEAFNVVDDNLPTSRQFLNLYKKNVRRFRSVYVPHWLSYLLCWAWERYSAWSQGQLPPAFNRRNWHAYWKRTSFSNHKLRERLGWAPIVPTATGLQRYFEACREASPHA